MFLDESVALRKVIKDEFKKSDRFCCLLLLFSSYGKVSTFNGWINHLIKIHTLHNNPNFLLQFKKENETKQSLTAVVFHPAARTTTMMTHEFYET